MLNLKEILRIGQKALTWNSKPTEESFPELPEVLIWLRCVIALAYGSYIGIKGINSPTQLIQIFNLLAFVPVMYCRMYLGVDSESFGSKIMLSGLLNAVALALLMWIYFFTAAHETEEAQLKTLLASLATSAAQTVAGGGETNAPATGKSQESEF